MKYTQELHDRVRQNLRMFDHPRFDDGDIDALLDEIDRLNAYAIRLLSEESRTWHCACGHNWTGTAIAEGKAYCPECEQPMRQMSEIRQERIAELEAEVEKHRWIPVSERLPIPSQKSDGYCSDSSDLVHVYPSPKNDRAVCYLHYLEKWSCSAEVTVTHWMPLPEPPKEETK